MIVAVISVVVVVDVEVIVTASIVVVVVVDVEVIVTASVVVVVVSSILSLYIHHRDVPIQYR